MLLTCFVFQSTLTQDNFDDVVNQKAPVVVRFMSEHRSRSLELDKDWKKFESMYYNVTDVFVGHVNCGKYRRLCLRETIWDPPGIRFYGHNKSRIQYDGGMSFESIGSWVEKLTSIKGWKIDDELLSPNNRTFHDLVQKQKCVFTMFHGPSCRKCQRFLPQLRTVAQAFKYESNVSIAEIDVNAFKSFFFDFKIKKYPTFLLFSEGSDYEYDGHLDSHEVVDFINEMCDTKRSLSGQLNLDAGVIIDAEGLVEDFVRNPKAKYIAEMKKVSGSEYYVYVMENVMNDSMNWLEIERARLESMIKSPNIDHENLDTAKQQLNILSVFIGSLED